MMRVLQAQGGGAESGAQVSIVAVNGKAVKNKAGIIARLGECPKHGILPSSLVRRDPAPGCRRSTHYGIYL